MAERIYILGFDYSSYLKNFNSYKYINIESPLKKINSLSSSKTEIIYVTTEKTNKDKTYSRYNYAKNELGRKLQNVYSNRLKVAQYPTIVDALRSPMMHCSFLQGSFIKFAIFLKLVKTISYCDVKKTIIFDQFSDPSFKLIKGSFLNLPRTSFIDRLIRLLLG